MFSGFQEILQQEYFNNTYQKYILSLINFLSILLISWLIKTYILTRLKKYAAKTDSKLDDLIIQLLDSIGTFFYIIFALNIAARNLTLPEVFWTLINGLTISVLSVYVVGKLQELISYFIKVFLVKRKDEEGTQFDASLANFLSVLTSVTLWSLTGIVILQNFNINITGLVGGLGITGIAVAFALQNVLSDIFASFSIYFDRPFKLGDFIIIGKDMGTVDKIGIKSTRIRSLSGELLVVSNRELSEVRIQNYGIMEKRRRSFKIAMEYATSNDKIRFATNGIKDLIDDLDICTFERCVFEDFGDFSINLACSYYVSSGDYNTFMQINQKINLEIKEMFEQNDIQFAFPTQTVMLSKKLNNL